MPLDWRRSGRCDSGTCVEVAEEGDDRVHVRQSANPATVVSFTRDEWDAFISGAKAGEFD